MHSRLLLHSQVPGRLLMGPGPTNSHPRILAAQALPLLGHMHPPFIKIMDEIKVHAAEAPARQQHPSTLPLTRHAQASCMLHAACESPASCHSRAKLIQHS